MYGFHETRAREPIGQISIPAAEAGGSNCYAVAIEGNCLYPEYQHGDIVICDPDQEPGIGDYVLIWWKGGGQQPSMKRLALLLPPRELWGMGGDCEWLLCCEQLNPPRSLHEKLADVEAVHRVIARAGTVREGSMKGQKMPTEPKRKRISPRIRDQK